MYKVYKLHIPQLRYGGRVVPLFESGDKNSRDSGILYEHRYCYVRFEWRGPLVTGLNNKRVY